MASTDIDDIWDMLGYGRFQLILFFACAAVQMYVTNEQFGIGLIIVAASCDLNIDRHRIGWLMTLISFGQFLLSYYMGYKIDTMGRRKLMLITLMLTMLMSFMSSFMPEYWTFIVFRFLGSCFLIGPSIANPSYLCEFTKIDLRPKVLIYCCYTMGLSLIYVPASAMGLNLLDNQMRSTGIYCFTSWRGLILANLLPGIIAWISLFHLPESPKFYLSINQAEKAMEVLEICCRVNKGKQVTLKSLGIESVTQPRLRANYEIDNKKENFLANVWKETKPLFSGLYILQTFNAIALLFLLFGTGACLLIWMPHVYKTFDSSEGMVLCDSVLSGQQNDTDEYFEESCAINDEKMTHLIISGCFCLLVYIIISLLLMCITRKGILLVFMLSAGCCGLLLNIVKLNIAVIALFIFLALLPLCGIRLVLSVIIDNVPTHLRSKSLALAMMFGRLGMLISNLFMTYTMHWNCLVTFNTYALILLLTAILIYLLPSDTGRKSSGY